MTAAAQRKTPTQSNGGSDQGISYTDKVDAEVERLWEVVPHWLTNIGGTANAITATMDTSQVVAITSYVRPRAYWLIPLSDNTIALTINIDGVGIRNVKDKDGNALGPGGVRANRLHLLVDDGANLRVVTTHDQVVAPSGVVFITSYSASNSAQIVDTTSLTATYPEILILLENIVPQTNAVELRLRVSEDGGLTYKTASYLATATGADGGSANAATTTTEIPLSRPNATLNLSNNSSRGLCGEIKVFAPSAGSNRTQFQGRVAYYNGTNISVYTIAGEYDGDSGAINAFKIDCSSGNIASGVVRVNGIKGS